MSHQSPDQRLLNLDRTGPRLLYYFMAVAEELSFSKAAARLNMSQPPLSMHIKELEALLDTQLFLRSTRSVKLTAAGAVLFEEMQKVQGMTRQSLRYVSQMGRGVAGHMNIGLVGTAVWGMLLPALRRFAEEMPCVTWSIEEISSTQQVDALLRHRIDMGIWREVRQSSLPTPLICHPIEQERMMVVLPHGHRLLMGEEAISLHMLQDETLICLSQDEHNLGRYVVSIFKDHGIVPHIAQKVMEPQTALALVGDGYGITLLPENYARIGWPGVQFRPLRETVTANLYAVVNSLTISPAVQRFLVSLTTQASA